MFRYEIYHRFGRLTITVLMVCIYLSVIGLPSAFADNHSPNFIATVKGKNHGPKKLVRVEIRGEDYKKLATNGKGEITTTLAPGKYTMIVRERGRQMKFDFLVKSAGTTTETFVLAW